MPYLVCMLVIKGALIVISLKRAQVFIKKTILFSHRELLRRLLKFLFFERVGKTLQVNHFIIKSSSNLVMDFLYSVSSNQKLSDNTLELLIVVCLTDDMFSFTYFRR